MSKIKVKVLKNGEGLYHLKKATFGSAGFDLIAANFDDINLRPNLSILVPCGFSLELPKNFEAQVRPRSGLALKKMITVLNSPGTIDSDYRGEIKVILVNLGKNNFEITPGLRIAQMVLCPITKAELLEVKDLDETIRGSDGFGSTGN